MGKGFHATDGVLGQDLSELIMEPCRKRASLILPLLVSIVLTLYPESAGAYGLHCQRLFCNTVITCV